MEKKLRHIVLTGPPGCGKTTLIKKVCSHLKDRNFSLHGFFTEEVRSGRKRIGFDVVLMNGTKVSLARIKSDESKLPTVGKYVVEVKSFESCVLPLFMSQDENSVLVLDEIGKMELLSVKFKEMVVKSISEKNHIILATIPIKSGKLVPVVEMIRDHPDTILLTVNEENRNLLVQKVLSLVLDATKK